MKILILRSNPIQPDPRVEKIARAMVIAGYSVRAVGWDRTGELPGEEDRSGLQITRLSIPAEYGHGMGNLPQLLRWQAGLLRWLIKNRNTFDIIHACDFDTILPALWVARCYKKRLVYDIFDFYADHLRNTPQWIKKIIRAVDLCVIGKADAVILVDDARREQIKGARPKRLEVIYNSPEDAGKVAAAQDLPNDYVLSLAYIGLLQVERGLFEVLQILRAHPEWHLDLAGFGGDAEKILEQIVGMDNITWHGRVDYEKALGLSGAADVLFATYDPAIPNHRFSSPNKIFEAMMLGKPVVVARNTNMDTIILNTHCGLVVPYGDVLELEKAFQQLQDPAVRLLLGQNARLAYDQIYGWNRMQQRLLNLYSILIR